MSSGTVLANRRLLARLLLVTAGMFCFGFVLVPLYNVFCDVTGLNGKTRVGNDATARASGVDGDRWLTVEFTGQVMADLPWELQAAQSKMRVHPGQTAIANYRLRNLSREAVTGQAVPSVSPGKAAAHFKKIECFCFTRQVLAGGESRDMQVRFYVEPDIPQSVTTLTLSYSFFNVAAKQAVGDERLIMSRQKPSRPPGEQGISESPQPLKSGQILTASYAATGAK